MMAETLCAASKSSRKYYFNPQFSKLPQDVQDRLKIISVTFAEDVGGVFMISFSEDGTPYFSVMPGENDSDIDEIGAELRIRRVQESEQELMQQLQLFYRIFVLGEDLGVLLEE